MSVTLVGDEDGKLPKTKAWIMYRIMVKFSKMFDFSIPDIYFLAFTYHW
jgi:hypothetical protein